MKDVDLDYYEDGVGLALDKSILSSILIEKISTQINTTSY